MYINKQEIAFIEPKQTMEGQLYYRVVFKYGQILGINKEDGEKLIQVMIELETKGSD